MLIRSPRHRTEDLRLWRELEEGDRANGELPGLAKKVERSLEEIRRFASEAPCYVGVSWGKDSVVAAHLCWRAGIESAFVWLRYGAENPDCFAVRDAFLSRYPVLAYREFSAPRRSKINAAFSIVADAIGTDRHISGVRADESGARKISMRKLGLSSQRSCRPLGWWTAQDVFAYLAIHDLPVHPVYAMLGGGRWPRERLRVASLGGSRGAGMGRAEWEREYYGDVLNRAAIR